MTSLDGQSPSRETPKIRPATAEDASIVMDMAEQFFHASPYSGVLFDRPAVQATFYNLIEHGCVLVTDGGFIAGMLSPLVFSPEVVVATEIAWWAPNGGGTELREAFEEWAKSKGAAAVQMSTLNNHYAQKLASNLSENGYTPVEVAYLKAL